MQTMENYQSPARARNPRRSPAADPRPLWLLLCWGTLSVVAGCALGPDYKRPALGAISPAYAGATNAVTTEATNAWKIAEPRAELPKDRWWTIFDDAELNELERQAAGANQEIKAATARFDQARAQMSVARAGLFPGISAVPAYVRERFSADTPLPPLGKAPGLSGTYNDFAVPLDLAYEVDLWGRVRRSLESARAQYQASADDVETIKLLIQAEVAADYFSLRALDAQKAVLNSSLEVFGKSLDLTRNLRKEGAVSELDVAQAETALKRTQARLPAVVLQRTRFEHALALLVGRSASQFRVPEHALSTPPPRVPSGVPSELLERRPDVAAAERRMAAANAGIGVAKAAFFPSVELNGLGGFESVSAGTLFKGASGLWAVGPTLTIPLFEGGRLRAGLQKSKAKYDETVASYRESVLAAFSEVEDGLAAQTLLANQSAAQNEALVAARKQVDIVNHQYREGLITYLDVATAQDTELDVEYTAVEVRGEQLVAAVTLVKALGGGWQSPAH